MLEQLEQLDRVLLQSINSFHYPWLDFIIYPMTKVWFWLPLFAWLLFRMWKHYGSKKLSIVLAFFALSIIFTDQSSNFIKHSVERYRPSHNLEIKDSLHLHVKQNGEVYCGGQYGFVSSHAANSFGLMMLFIYFFYPINKKTVWVFPLWAIVFSYTRLYLGVHYPADILCGALLGMLCGTFCIWLYRLAEKQIEEKKKDV